MGPNGICLYAGELLKLSWGAECWEAIMRIQQQAQAEAGTRKEMEKRNLRKLAIRHNVDPDSLPVEDLSGGVFSYSPADIDFVWQTGPLAGGGERY